MLDFFRNFGKSSEEKEQEALNAYLDNELTPKQRQQFDEDLGQDRELQARLEQMRALKQQMRQLPQRQVPRNFTLDPAVYGRPAREPLVQAYPILRTATALTALIFVFLLAVNFFLSGSFSQGTVLEEPMAISSEPQMEAAVEESAPVEATQEMEAAAEMIEEEAEAEEPADEIISGESEMAPQAQMVPPSEEVQEELLPLATLPPEDQAREFGAEVEGTIVADAPLADEAAGATTMDTEAVPGLLPEEELPQLNTEMESDQTSGSQIAYGLNLAPLTILLLVLGLVFVVLLFLTLLARRRI